MAATPSPFEARFARTSGDGVESEVPASSDP
jgi:hypothetical protein